MNIHTRPDNEFNPKKRLGYVHVYTGEGKGKTSAALGVMVRAAGQGFRVLMVQFLKGDKQSGEFLAIQEMGDHVEIMQFGRPDLDSLDNLQTVDGYFADQALSYARESMRGKRPDVLVLDELTTAIKQDLVAIEDVLDFLDNRHRDVEVIITGKDAHPALLNAADLVTVMEPIKDYYSHQNFNSRLGIEH